MQAIVGRTEARFASNSYRIGEGKVTKSKPCQFLQVDLFELRVRFSNPATQEERTAGRSGEASPAVCLY